MLLAYLRSLALNHRCAVERYTMASLATCPGSSNTRRWWPLGIFQAEELNRYEQIIKFSMMFGHINIFLFFLFKIVSSLCPKKDTNQWRCVCFSEQRSFGARLLRKTVPEPMAQLFGAILNVLKIWPHLHSWAIRP